MSAILVLLMQWPWFLFFIVAVALVFSLVLGLIGGLSFSTEGWDIYEAGEGAVEGFLLGGAISIGLTLISFLLAALVSLFQWMGMVPLVAS